MIFYGKKVCFIGAHPDDIELGCGALIAHILNSTDVLCVTLSDNQENPELQNLVDEHYRSMDLLGVPRDQIILGTFATRKFPHARQDLEYLIQINRDYCPDIVFVHIDAIFTRIIMLPPKRPARLPRNDASWGTMLCAAAMVSFRTSWWKSLSRTSNASSRHWRNTRPISRDITLTPASCAATLIRHGALAERPYAEGFDILRIVGNFRRP